MLKNFVLISNNHLSRNIGGAEVQADILAKKLCDLGFNVSYISADIESKFIYQGYDVYPMPKNKRQFYYLLKKLDADVYYQRGRKTLTGQIASFCQKNKKCFVFASSMDIDCNYFKNFLREPIFKKNRSKIKSLIKSIRNNIHNFFSDLFSLWGMYQANLVLSQSASQKESLHSKLGIESEIFYNIHPKPELQKVKIHRDVPTVLWLANIKSWKQPEIYLRLAKDLSAYKINFKMAGYIKDQKYKSLIEETELTNKRFEYLGGQTYESSNELIDIADIFVNTSKSQEGFPNTFIQSWLRGVPVISLNFDPDDIILKNQLGCISNSYEKLKSQVIDLAEDSDKRSKIAEKAIDFSNNHFISERKIDDFIRLVSEAKSKMN